jgi:hypothetical protein
MPALKPVVFAGARSCAGMRSGVCFLRCLPLLLGFVAVACQTPASSEIPGTYFVKYSFGEELLTIEPKGMYTQAITIYADHVQLTTRGTWTYADKDAEITPHNHTSVHDGYGVRNPKLEDPGNHWIAVMSVRKDLANRVVIVASADDYGFDYRKIK